MGIVLARVVSVTPEIIEDFGAPDIFATGWTMAYGSEVITGISHIDSVDNGVVRRRIVCRVHYPRTQWMACVEATIGSMREGGNH